MLKKILLINPNKKSFKKKSDKIFQSKHLNFGILSIASFFPENIIIYDCQGKEDDEILCDIYKIIDKNKIDMVGISLISAYTEQCAFFIAEKLSKQFENIDIIYGGKDYVQFIAEYLLRKKKAKAVVKNEGELFFKELLKDKKDIFDCSGICYLNENNELLENSIFNDFNELHVFNHQLYPDYLEYVPSIEVSRGCKKKCVFCTNNKISQKKKNVKDIVKEISNIVEIYGQGVCIYFQTPHFLLSKKDLKEIYQFRLSSKNQFVWRTQTSVDYLTKENLDCLYNAGARVIDVGFESASPEVLTLMEKTSNPLKYIEKMKLALRHAKDIGLRIKLNILLFVGENRHTLKCTKDFLKENLYDFHSFSAYSVMFFPSFGSEKFKKLIETQGGRLNPVRFSQHVLSVNLNSNISHAKAEEIARLFLKSFQSKEMYMSQRQLGYFPKGINYPLNPDVSSLPFYSSKEEMNESQENLDVLIEEF